MPCKSCGGKKNRVRDLRSSAKVRIYCPACKTDHTEEEYRTCSKRLATVKKKALTTEVAPMIKAVRAVSTPSVSKVSSAIVKGPIVRKSGLTLSDVPRRRV